MHSAHAEAIRVQSLLKLVIVLQKRQLNQQQMAHSLTQQIQILPVSQHEDTDAGTRSVLFNVFEGLVKPTTDGDVTPAVASDYTISDDAKTYTFTLRDGITFQDGNPVTVEDIKYSLERSAEMDGESSALSAISAINIVDDIVRSKFRVYLQPVCCNP